MEPNSGILTHSLQQFISQFKLGLGSLKPDAMSLLGLLCVLELTLAALWWGYSGNEALGKLLKKILMFGFFVWVVENYDTLISVVLSGFVSSGTKAGGGALNIMEDPSRIIDQGLVVIRPMLQMAIDLSSSWNLFDAFLSLIALLVIFLSFVVLAAQVFVTRVEFALVSTLGLILLPFGVFKQTAFMAEKVFGAVFTFGVKMMVLAFIVSVAFPLIQQYQFPEGFDWIHILSLMATSLTYAVLALRAPGVASAIISGAPSLGTTAIGAAGGIASGLAGIGLAGAAPVVSPGLSAGKTLLASAVGLGKGSDGSAPAGGSGGSGGGPFQTVPNVGGAASQGSAQTSSSSTLNSKINESDSEKRKLKSDFVDSIGKETSACEKPTQKNGGRKFGGTSKEDRERKESRITTLGKSVKDPVSAALREDGQAGAGVNVPLRASNDD